MKLKIFGLMLIIFMFWLAGCDLKWWYNRLDVVLLESIDEYFDLTTEQEEFLVPILKTHLKRHKKDILPKHIAFLKNTKNKIKDNITAKEVDEFFDEYQQQIRILTEDIVKDISRFVVMLNKEQISYFEKELKNNNEEFQERLAMSHQERLERRAEKTVEMLEEWCDELTSKQKAVIINLSKQLPDNREKWYKRRIERQKYFIKLLKNNSKAEDFEKTLRDWFVKKPMLLSPEMYKAIRNMIIKIDGIITEKQRKHALDKLQEWIQRLNDLKS